jgi:hypothetical protein
MSINS